MCDAQAAGWLTLLFLALPSFSEVFQSESWRSTRVRSPTTRAIGPQALAPGIIVLLALVSLVGPELVEKSEGRFNIGQPQHAHAVWLIVGVAVVPFIYEFLYRAIVARHQTGP